MRTLYLDPFSGIAGDMFLALAIDLGVDPAELPAALARVDLAGYALDVRRESRCGIAGTFVDVTVAEGQPERTWADIDRLLAASALDEPDRDLARRIFRRLGEAEAAVHGVALEAVHFHEVGAVDSIVDIVGAAVARNRLGVDRVLCAPLPLGLGSVETGHGTYPLPAPATLELLRGCPTRPDDSGCELVTPTGAAIAAEVATFAPLPAMTVEQVGYGLGRRDMKDRPNVLRGVIGAVEPDAGHDTVSVIETHLDDCNPEWLGGLMELLFERGALDVAWGPLQMKKNRPGVRVTVLVPVAAAPELERLLLRHSSAIGVRRHEARRRMLHRESRTVRTPLGEAAVKCLFDGNDLVRVTPEYESCRRLAGASGRPLPDIYRLVERAADAFFEPQGD